MFGPAKANDLEHSVQHLAAVHLDDVLAALEAERLHGVGGQHADLSVGGDVIRAHRVSIELHELAKAAGTRLLVSPYRSSSITPERLPHAVGLGGLVE